MRSFKAVTTAMALLLFAGIAHPLDTFLGGEFVTTGTASKGGAYTGVLKVTPTGPTTFRVSEELRYASGNTVTYAGDATLSGDTLRVSGETSVGFLGKLAGKKGEGWTATFKVGTDGMLKSGSWALAKSGTTASETITTGKKNAATGDLLVLLDGSGQPVAKAKKKTDGVVLAVNLDDDDKDGGSGADGVTTITTDRDDENGVSNEDDLLAFRLAKPANAALGSRFLLSFSDKLAVWRTKTKAPGTRIKNGDTIEAKDETLWLEGRDASAGGTPETLSVQLLAPNGAATLQDEGKVFVARSAFLLLGHGHSSSSSLESWLGSHKADSRKNPVLVRGKDEKGKAQAWAVYLWSTEKQAKIALSTAGSVIAYDGHSNFGLGFAFETNFSRVSQFLNIADAQVPVNWPYLRDHQDHPNLIFEDAEYGDDASTPKFSDPVAVDRWIQGDNDQYHTRRWPAGGNGGGTRYPLVRGKDYKWDDHHYLVDSDATNARIVVKAGSRDMPAKRWSKLFLNSCYGGPYYYDSFGGRGTLFFTTDEASSPLTSAIFIESCIEGKSNDQTLKALNKAENINDYHVFGE